MLASNRCAGSVTAWCAIQAIVHSFRIVSSLLLRDSEAGAVASGQVWSTASPANSRRASHALRFSMAILRSHHTQPCYTARDKRRVGMRTRSSFVQLAGLVLVGVVP